MSESNENEDKSQYQESDGNDSRSFDTTYEKIDTILSEKNGKYLVLWCKHEFKDLTWETEVDREQLKLFHKREKYQFPNKNDDVFATPTNKLSIDDYYDSLVPCELITLKKMICCYNYRKDFLLKENMGIDTSNACITFLSILQTKANEHGPYLIVSDRRWYDKLRERSEMLSIYYGGNGESCEKINELYFQDEIESPHFHTLVISPQKFEQHIQDISKIHYRVAIFHSNKAQLIYKKYSSLKVGMSICINVVNLSQSSKQIGMLSSAIITKKCSKQLTSKEIKPIQEINGQIQHSLRKLNLHGDSQFVSPPIISIDCPLSEVQKVICQSVLTEYSQTMPRAAVEKVLRICSHPFLCMNGEYDLGSPDLISSSKKLEVLIEILNNCERHLMKVLIISQFQQMHEYIMDVLDEKDIIYDNLSSYFKRTTAPSDDTTIYLYNPKYNKKLPDYFGLENIQCVVIFDGGTTVWNEMIQKHRLSRKPLFNVSKIYRLECLGCCERELLSLSELSTDVIKNKADAILHTVAIYAFSDFMIPSVDELLSNGVLDEKVESVSPIGKCIQQCDFTPTLNGEIIHGQPPELNPERIIEKPSKSGHDKGNSSDDEKEKENENDDYLYEWTIHQRNQLTRGLFQMGLNRLESLQKVVGLYLPTEEIEKMIPPILNYLLKSSGSQSGYMTTRSYIKKIGEKYNIKKITEIPVFNDKYYLESIKSKATDLIRRLEQLDFLHNSLGGDNDPPDISAEQVPFFRFGYNLSEWWTENHDRALAYLTWRFGIGCFDHYEEYAETNKFCELFVNFPEFMEYDILTKRAINLCDNAKKIPVTDQKVIETLSKRPTKWPEEVQAMIIRYLLRYGIIEDKTGKPDYDLFADELQCPDLDGDELKDYITDLISFCKKESTNHAKRILDRVDAMKDLRKLLRSGKDFLEKISKAPHWRSLPKKWNENPEIERYYFEKVESHGFKDLQSILRDQVFSNVLENGIPFFLYTEDEVVRRINILAGKIEKSQSKRSTNLPSSPFSPSTSRKPSSSSSSGSTTKKKAPKAAPSPSSGKKIVVNRIKELKKGVKFPVQVTQFGQILDLGHIVTDREKFHNDRYIYPAGYKATKQFADLKHPDEKITWISEIVDKGGDAPVFRIYPQDRPKECIEGETTSSPWVTALRTLSSIRGEKKANTISGPEAFLLSHPTTIYLIQHMEHARECSNYVWKHIQGDDSDEGDDNE